MLDAKQIGQNLREARLRAGLTSRAVAEKSGLTRETVSYVERARHGTSVYTMISLCDALGVSMDEICGRDAKKGKGYE